MATRHACSRVRQSGIGLEVPGGEQTKGPRGAQVRFTRRVREFGAFSGASAFHLCRDLRSKCLEKGVVLRIFSFFSFFTITLKTSAKPSLF